MVKFYINCIKFSLIIKLKIHFFFINISLIKIVNIFIMWNNLLENILIISEHYWLIFIFDNNILKIIILNILNISIWFLHNNIYDKRSELEYN